MLHDEMTRRGRPESGFYRKAKGRQSAKQRRESLHVPLLSVSHKCMEEGTVVICKTLSNVVKV
jgi:hypothetical protein